MRATEARMRAALDRPSPDIRLYLLHGPDEAGAQALASRLARALGADAERIDIEPATLRSDPARLADEAAALSLFGTPRHIRVAGAGEESAAAVTSLLDADRAGNPVVMIAPALKTTSKLVKLALAADAALVLGCYVPTGDALEALATSIARDHGLQATGAAARRLAQACGGDRAILAREIEKLALYLDADATRVVPLDDAALDAVGADVGDAGLDDVIDALVAAQPRALGEALRRLEQAGVSPIPWLRLAARRLSALATIRADIDAGGDAATIMTRNGIYGRAQPATTMALRRWRPEAIAAAQATLRQVERAAMASGNAGIVLANHAALTVARAR